MAIRSRFAAAAQRRQQRQLRRGKAPRVSPTIEREHMRNARRVLAAFHDAIMRELVPAAIAAGYTLERVDTSGLHVLATLHSLGDRARKAATAFKKPARTIGKRLVDFSAKEAVRTMGEVAVISTQSVATFADEFADDAAVKLESFMLNSLSLAEKLIYGAAMLGLDGAQLQEQVSDGLDAQQSRVTGSASNAIGQWSADINKTRQEDSGVERAVWTTMHDPKVRPAHKALDGDVYSLDEPPLKASDSDNGEDCFPGDDWNCRCAGVPLIGGEKASTFERPAVDTRYQLPVGSGAGFMEEDEAA
jgi:SPP1 gp7 family putative phage head morphogenesis protein